MVSAVIRILTFMTREKGVSIDDSADAQFYNEWFSNIALAASNIRRISDG